PDKTVESSKSRSRCADRRKRFPILNKSPILFSDMNALHRVNLPEQLDAVPVAVFLNLLLICGFRVGEESVRLPRQSVNSCADVFLRELENLAGTAVPVRGFSQRQRRFRGVALLPEIVQAIDEQFGRE